MSNFPAVGTFIAESGTNESRCLALEEFLQAVKQMLGAGTEEALVISSGRIVPTKGMVRIDTEAGAATDDLDHIGGDNLPAGSVMMLRITDQSRKVNIRHQRGTAEEIFLADEAAGHLLGNSATRMMFYRSASQWVQLGPPMFGADKSAFRNWLGLTAFATAVAATPLEVLDASGTGVVIGTSMALLKPFETAPQTIVVSGNGTAAHGFGGKPRQVWPVIRCVTAQWGYLIGEEVQMGDKVTTSATTTNVSWAFPTTGLQIVEKNGGALRSITDGSWRLVVYARR